MAHIRVVVRQLLGLLVDRIGHFSAAIANVHAVKTGEGVYIALALVIFNSNTLRSPNDLARKSAARVIVRMGRRMHEVCTVFVEQLLELLCHELLLRFWSFR